MKIAIIDNVPHFLQGGVALYGFNLIKLFQSKGHQVDEYVFSGVDEINGWENKIANKKLLEPITLPSFNKMNKQKELVAELNSLLTKYDKIIVNGQKAITKNMINSNGVYVVQHENLDRYDNPFTKLQKFPFIIFNKARKELSTKGNRLLMAKNTVFFCKETSSPKAGKSFFVPLSSNFKITKESRINRSIWLGRISWTSRKYKNLDMISRNHKELLLDIYGPEHPIIDKLGLRDSYKGLLTSNNKFKTFANYKVLALPSKSEGFSYVTIEALSLGIPVVGYNTWDGSKFFGKSGAFFAIDYKNEKKFVGKVNEIISMNDTDYEILSKKAKEFHKKYLSKKSFDSNWINIIGGKCE